MIKDYKGETPNNVTTPEKAKAQKPFYKNWKFWVLTGLMTLFGACSIYGLVLGSQYVQAIERASHIIADANGNSQSVAPKARRANNANNVRAVDISTLHWGTGWGGFYSSALVGSIKSPATSNDCPLLVCDKYTTIRWGSYQNMMVSLIEGASDYAYNDYLYIKDDNYTSVDAFKNANVGIYVYYQANDSYTGETAVVVAEESGYQEGYSDGSDAINLNQSVKVLLPAGVENSCSVATFLDGVPDQQVTLSSSSSFGAYGEFARDRTQKLRIDLTLPSGYRAFFMYVPNWTSGFPSDENYSLRQSWAVSGVTYLPTWVAKPEIYVGITSALVDDLTYNTISVAFDVDHWGDVRVGAYQEGYQDGYVDGQQNPTAYQSGYDAGYSDGQAQGETEGFNRGVAVGSSGSQSLAMMFKTAFQLPFDQLYRFLNFNLLGINFLALFTALISVSIGIMVIKKVL